MAEHGDQLEFLDPSGTRNRERALQVRRHIRRLLMEWDPIGVAGIEEARDEYDCMIDPLIRLLVEEAGPAQLLNWVKTERANHFGLPVGSSADLKLVAKLESWWNTYNSNKGNSAPNFAQLALDFTLASDLVGAANDAGRALDLNHRLLAVESSSPKRLDDLARDRLDRYVSKELSRAARGLINTIGDVLADDLLWKRLRESSTDFQSIAFRREMQLREIISHHIPDLLTSLGYVPPPPTDSWTSWVQGSLARALDSDKSDRDRTEEAKRELAFLRLRLNVLVEKMTRSLEEEGSRSSPERRRNLRGALSAAVGVARQSAIPAAIGAGVAGGIAGGPVAALTGVGGSAVVGTLVSEGAKEFFKKTVEAAVIAGLGHTAPRRTSTGHPLPEKFSQLREALLLFHSAREGSQQESARFIVRRSIFDLLAYADCLSAPAQQDLVAKVDKLLMELTCNTPDPASTNDKLASILDSIRSIT
jgi:hypothetical protein